MYAIYSLYKCFIVLCKMNIFTVKIQYRYIICLVTNTVPTMVPNS